MRQSEIFLLLFSSLIAFAWYQNNTPGELAWAILGLILVFIPRFVAYGNARISQIHRKEKIRNGSVARIIEKISPMDFILALIIFWSRVLWSNI